MISKLARNVKPICMICFFFEVINNKINYSVKDDTL